VSKKENREEFTNFPRFLYKYRKIDKFTEDIFSRNRLYLPSPLEFNDPFDCRIEMSFDATEREQKKRFKEILKDVRPESSRQERNALVKKLEKTGWIKNVINKAEAITAKMINGLRVLCLSAKNNDLLMWSHYAHNHEGFCLKFDVAKNPGVLGNSKPVIYSEKYPFPNFFKTPTEEITDMVLMTKAKEWKYEEEYRFIPKHYKQYKYWNFQESLVGIIFGCQIKKEAEDYLISLLEKYNHRVTIYHSIIGKQKFALDILPAMTIK